MLKDHPAVAEMIHLLEENGRQEQAAEFSRLIAAVDSVGQQYDAMQMEVNDLRQQLVNAVKERHPLKDTLFRTIHALEDQANGIHTRLQIIQNRIIFIAEKAVENFKRMGVSTLDTAVSKLNVNKSLETAQQMISNCMNDLEDSICKVEAMGQELRSAGAHLKNAGRAAAGQEVQEVDGGQAGRFQAAVLAPMRAVSSTLDRINRTVSAAMAAVDRLSRAAEQGRGKREKTSVRHRLEQKEDRPAPAPARKPREETR